MGVHYNHEQNRVTLTQGERREEYTVEDFDANADAICAAFFIPEPEEE